MDVMNTSVNRRWVFSGRSFAGALLLGIFVASLSGCYALFSPIDLRDEKYFDPFITNNQVRLDSATRELLKKQEKISVGHNSKFRVWVFDNPYCCRNTQDAVAYTEAIDALNGDDPILKVRDHVISLLETDLSRENLRIRPPAINAAGLYDADFVLILKNDSLTLTNGNLRDASDPDGVIYAISYEARGQLTRKTDFKILWQDRCSLYAPDIGIPKASFGNLKANNWALLHEMIESIADRCAKQMLASFLSNPIRN